MTINQLTALMISKGYTFNEGLRTIGKSKRTYYRWMADSGKREQLRVLINELNQLKRGETILY